MWNELLSGIGRLTSDPYLKLYKSPCLIYILKNHGHEMLKEISKFKANLEQRELQVEKSLEPGMVDHAIHLSIQKTEQVPGPPSLGSE